MVPTVNDVTQTAISVVPTQRYRLAQVRIFDVVTLVGSMH